MPRVWKVQETNTVGTVKLCTTIEGDHLLVNPSDPTFAPGTTIETALIADGSGNYCASVDLSNGSYFSFGKEVLAPGCVAPGLTSWFRADDGAVTSGSWADYNSNGVILTQTTNGNKPTINTTTNLANFNPSITFDG